MPNGTPPKKGLERNGMGYEEAGNNEVSLVEAAVRKTRASEVSAHRFWHVLVRDDFTC